MIVFDASGSMSGNEKLGIATTITRIDEVRSALARVLPSVTTHRRVGLITVRALTISAMYGSIFALRRTRPAASWKR